ncbi:hypothetical protein BGZ93_000227 [Podila epicladia]|nr:hypothetical protein BGZ92_000648 [Podila epicladia]KAG0086233.1 hypothetical protein BGZ93_000227 [Podila epicladia]
MKFTIAVVASAVLAVASADMLQINNPTNGTTWTTGVPNFVGWTGNCASMGNDSKTVKVDLVNGPANAVRYVATLGALDCSGTNTRADMTVPGTVVSGEYSIVVRTSPQQSYTNSFKINNPAAPEPAPASPSGGQPAPSSPTTAHSAASHAASGAMFVLVGLAATAFQFL